MANSTAVRKSSIRLPQSGNFLERKRALTDLCEETLSADEEDFNQIVAILTGELKSKHAPMRAMAVKGLGHAMRRMSVDQQQPVIESIVHMVGDKNENVRDTAFSAAERFMHHIHHDRVPEMIKTLDGQLQTAAENDFLQENVAKLKIGMTKLKSGGIAANPQLLEMMDNKHPNVRLLAVQTIANSFSRLPKDDRPVIRDRLRQKMNDESGDVRIVVFPIALKTAKNSDDLAELTKQLLTGTNLSENELEIFASNIQDVVNADASNFKPVNTPHLKIGEKMGSARKRPLTFRPEGLDTKNGKVWHKIRCQFRDTASMVERVKETYDLGNRHRRNYMAFLEVKDDLTPLQKFGNWVTGGRLYNQNATT
jgi:hypothetical protein